MAPITLTRKQALSILLILALGLAALLVERLIVTDKERIEALIRELRLAVEQGNAEALVKNFSEDFDAEGFSSDDMQGVADRFFKAHGPVRFRRFGVGVNRAGRAALAEVHANTESRQGHAVGQQGRSIWDMEFQKESDNRWRITSITPAYIGGQEVGSWDDLLKLVKF